MKIKNCHPKIEDGIDLRLFPHVQRTLVRARRAYYDNNQLMGRSGIISYEEMKKMVEENLTVEKVGIGDCWR